MSAVFENPVFIKMVTTIVAWIVLYFIVYFIAAAQGLQKDILKNAFVLSGKIKRISEDYRNLAEKKSTLSKDEITTALKKMKHYGRRGSAILQVYLLENAENLDVKAAEQRLGKITTECRDVIRAYVEGTDTDLVAELQDIVRISEEAEKILSAVLKQREEDKLLKF